MASSSTTQQPRRSCPWQRGLDLTVGMIGQEQDLYSHTRTSRPDGAVSASNTYYSEQSSEYADSEQLHSDTATVSKFTT